MGNVTKNWILIILAIMWSMAAAQKNQFLSKGGMDVYTPDVLWNLDTAHHGVSANTHRLYATLHNASLDLLNGPAYANGRAGALQFYGNPSSYAEIGNIGGVLNATSLFTWAMVLKGDSETGQGVVMEYWDGVGGFRICQSGTNIVVQAQDTLNRTHTVTVPGVFTGLQWKFFSISFVNFDPVIPKTTNGFRFSSFLDAIDSDTPAAGSSDVSVPDPTVLRGTGDVRLGASRDSSKPAFAGRVACLRYHTVWMLKFGKDAAYPLTCDPNGTFKDSLAALSENTVDYVETTTTVMSTVTTTAETTTTRALTTQTTQRQTTDKTATSTVPQTTDDTQTTVKQETTSETAATTSTEGQTTTDTPTTDSQTTMQQDTTSTTPATALPQTTVDTPTAPAQSTSQQISLGQTTDGQTTGGQTTQSPTAATTEGGTTDNQTIGATEVYTASSINSAPGAYTVSEACYTLHKQPATAISAAILAQLTVDSLGACITACSRHTGCVAIAVETVVTDNFLTGTCVLAGIGYAFVQDSGFCLFRFN